MLSNIKDNCLNQIFSFLDDGPKLKILKYNKILQNKLSINLVNFKFFSKRYIIYAENRRGKEYQSYTDFFIFEGEYLQGERNGKGKEYDYYGKLIFEGEYLNGKKKRKRKRIYKFKW